MKDKAINISKFVGLGFFEPIIRLASGEEVKKNLNEMLRKIVFPIVSILLFLMVWHLGSQALHNVEKDHKIEVARESGGEAAVTAELARIESGESTINALPSPVSVLAAFNTLIADHKVISEKKDAFTAKVAKTNEKREAQGLAPITYTGRPSFVDLK